MAELRLRPVGPDDEAAVRRAQELLRADDFPFALWYDPGAPWTDHVERLEAYGRGIDLPPGLVPGTFLLADVDGALVGRASIRFALNDYLFEAGGHIGYAVLPEFRRQGFATEILRQSLVIARAHGVDRVLVSCDDANSASARVIERNGGVLEDVRPDPESGVPTRRYWIG